eukprot:scaffold289_cov144-Skeletonema_menzelii.AAC.11
MMTMMNPHPQQSNSNDNEEDTPSQLGLLHLCCPIEYAHAASNIKPLPTSTTPLAGEEQVSSTRSKDSIRMVDRGRGRRAVVSRQPLALAQFPTHHTLNR